MKRYLINNGKRGRTCSERKISKLLEGREMTLKNQSETYNLKTDEDFEEKKGISEHKNINKESDMLNNKNSNPDTEHEDMKFNDHLYKRKLNDLKDTDTESAVEKKKVVWSDSDHGELYGNQSVKLKNTDIQTDKLDNNSIQLAVRSTAASITNRQKASTNERKAFRKKWLKYK